MSNDFEHEIQTFRTLGLRERLRSVVTILSVLILAANLGCQENATHNVHNDPVPEHEEFTMDSAATSESRNINVYLPPDYLTSETNYPVLYMPDGGIKEDFPHVANTIALLIQNGEIAPLILVGVENTNRGLDMTCQTEVDYDLKAIPTNGGSSAFRKFFGSELRPEIEERYRCNGETALVGESLAGLFVVETLSSIAISRLIRRCCGTKPAWSIRPRTRFLVNRIRERSCGLLLPMQSTLSLTSSG